MCEIQIGGDKDKIRGNGSRYVGANLLTALSLAGASLSARPFPLDLLYSLAPLSPLSDSLLSAGFVVAWLRIFTSPPS